MQHSTEIAKDLFEAGGLRLYKCVGEYGWQPGDCYTTYLYATDPDDAKRKAIEVFSHYPSWGRIGEHNVNIVQV